MKRSKYFSGILGSGFLLIFLCLAMVIPVKADTISPSDTTLVLEEDETVFTFDVIVDTDEAFAGAEFGIKPSTGELVFESLTYQDEQIAAASHLQKVVDGILYFGFFGDDNVFEASEHKVATIKYGYVGEGEAALTIDSSKIVQIAADEEGPYTEAHEGNSDGFSVKISRHRKTEGDFVADEINALPSELTAADKEAVEAVRAKFDALSDEEKAKVPADVLAKLAAAEAKIEAAEAMGELTDIEAQLAMSEARFSLKIDILTVKLGGYTAAKYTDATYAPFKEALEAAEAVLAKADATLEDLTGADAALNAAKDALKTKSANPMKVKATAKTVKASKVKKAKQVVKPLKVSGAEGTVSYKKTGGSGKLTINKKNGKVTVKKGTKKGTYKIKVTVTAKGNGTYKKGTKKVTVTVKVK